MAPSACPPRPDARIRVLGCTLKGNNVYNTHGTDQSTTRTTANGGSVRFVITIQNDGGVAGSFTVNAYQPPSTEFTVAFYRGWHPRTDITAALVAGPFTTRILAPGEVHHFTAVVRTSADATPCTGLAGIVVPTSVGNPAQSDVVGYTVVSTCV